MVVAVTVFSDRRGKYDGPDPAMSAMERIGLGQSREDKKVNPQNLRTAAAYEGWLHRQGSYKQDHLAMLSHLQSREEDLGVSSYSNPGPGSERPGSVRLGGAWPTEPLPNKTSGPCAHCGAPVARGQGRIVKTASGWEPAHHEGQHPARAVEAPVAPVEPLRRPNKYDDTCAECRLPVRAGEGQITKRGSTYGVIHAGGCKDKVSCARCGTALKDPASRKLGLGPECSGHGAP